MHASSVRRAIGIVALVSGCTAIPAMASETDCEIRVFKAGTLNSESPSALQSGIIAGFVEAKRLEQFPTATVEAQLELALTPEAIVTQVESIDWKSLLKARSVGVAFDNAVLAKKDIRDRLKSRKRNTDVQSPCYLELYASQQDFTGSFIKSHLYSHFTLIDFRSGRPSNTRAIVWSRSRSFPAKEEAELELALDSMRQTFGENLRKFLGKKFKGVI